MIEQLRSKQSGDTVAQYVSYLHVDLEDIGIGLGMIVDTGRINYGLEGPQLIAFVRLALKELVRLGGRPRHIAPPSQPKRPEVPLYYGENESAIVEGVINDWVKMGMPDLTWGDFWFISPKTADMPMDKDWYRAP
jgi:hypothetical protein